MRLYNAAGRPRPLTAESIIATAVRRTGLSNLGAGDPEVPLGILADSFREEARLHPFGRMMARERLVRVLCNRLRITEELERHPETLGSPLRRPLFVLGFPRTGTSLLYNLLAQDPRGRPLLTWESYHPAPPPRPETRTTDRRILRTRVAVRILKYLAPDLDAIHEVRADRPEECLPLQMNTLVTWAFLVLADMPGYERWLVSQGDGTFVAAYRFYKSQLQLLQRFVSGDHWVLKSPAHLWSMEALLEVFPDACIVQTHRDPRRVLPSACSLLGVMRGVLSDDANPRALGRHALESAASGIERMLASRSRVPAERVIDIQYRDLMDDPVRTVRRIYDKFGYTMPGDMEPRLTGYIAGNPKGRHGAHRYTLAQFGIRPEEVDETFQSYREFFDIPREG